METVGGWLKNAVEQLKTAGVDSPARDAQIILRHVLGYEELDLITNGMRNLSVKEILDANSMLNRRIQREPIAYIVSYKDFYGLKITLNDTVLIPRPESEAIVEWTIKNAKKFKLKNILDIGTGSGAIAIAIKKQLKRSHVYASDIDEKALDLAKLNAKNHKTKIVFYQADILEECPEDIDLIIANLPYVAERTKLEPELSYEPQQAIFSGKDGLDHYRKLAGQLEKIDNKPILLIEHEPNQFEELQALFSKQDYSATAISDFVVLFQSK